MSEADKNLNKSSSLNVSDNRRVHVDRWAIYSALFLSIVGGFIGGFMGIQVFSEQAALDKLTENRETFVLQESELIADVAENTGKSVVSITVETNQITLFGSQDAEGAGTGVIVSSDGLIVTNKHVVAGGDSYRVITHDGEEYTDVSLVDVDPFNDIAFLKINGASDLVEAKLGDSSKIRVGQKVVAIGNALGQFGNTVTSGIISGIGRPVIAGDGFGSQLESLQNLFQTDAAINPGNSGGPLTNINGEVIGINTAVAGNAENIGFAIPINDVKPSVDSVKKHGRLVKPYLGVRYVSITKDLARELGLENEHGALILPARAGSPSVIPNSPADKAGLKENDIILSISGQRLDERNSLATVIGRHNVGEEITLSVLRGGKQMELKAKLEEAPSF